LLEDKKSGRFCFAIHTSSYCRRGFFNGPMQLKAISFCAQQLF